VQPESGLEKKCCESLEVGRGVSMGEWHRATATREAAAPRLQCCRETYLVVREPGTADIGIVGVRTDGSHYAFTYNVLDRHPNHRERD
jgi:hypothetical protein